MERGGECRESGREDEGRDGEKGREVGYTEVKSETEGCEREGGRGCVRGEGVWGEGVLGERVCGERVCGGEENGREWKDWGLRLVCSCTP